MKGNWGTRTSALSTITKADWLLSGVTYSEFEMDLIKAECKPSNQAWSAGGTGSLKKNHTNSQNTSPCICLLGIWATGEKLLAVSNLNTSNPIPAQKRFWLLFYFSNLKHSKTPIMTMRLQAFALKSSPFLSCSFQLLDEFLDLVFN